MASPIVKYASNAVDASGATIVVSVPSVMAGNGVIFFVTADTLTATNLTVSDGVDTTGTVTMHAGDASTNCAAGRFVHLIASTSGDKVYTATLGGAFSERRIIAAEFDFTGSLSLDVTTAQQGNSNSANSGAIFTASEPILVFGGLTAPFCRSFRVH